MSEKLDQEHLSRALARLATWPSQASQLARLLRLTQEHKAAEDAFMARVRRGEGGAQPTAEVRARAERLDMELAVRAVAFADDLRMALEFTAETPKVQNSSV